MIKRIVEVTGYEPTTLSLSNRQMVVKKDGKQAGQVPLEDLGILIISRQVLSVSGSLLLACTEENVCVMICDDKHIPSGMLLPLIGHHTQSKNISIQVSASLPAKKKLWKEIVVAKIENQAKTLGRYSAAPNPLLQWAKDVRSGDPSNEEARAARYYWQKLFGKDFRRRRDGQPPNNLLNYGYAVLRGAVARATVGAGLHPSIGIHHKNQYDGYCLVDDLMEPFRPLVDDKAKEIHSAKGEMQEELTKEDKQSLIELLFCEVSINKHREQFFTALHRYTASFREALAGKEKLRIPKW